MKAAEAPGRDVLCDVPAGRAHPSELKRRLGSRRSQSGSWFALAADSCYHQVMANEREMNRAPRGDNSQK